MPESPSSSSSDVGVANRLDNSERKLNCCCLDASGKRCASNQFGYWCKPHGPQAKSHPQYASLSATGRKLSNNKKSKQSDLDYYRREGNLAYHLLRRVQFLHQIPADELPLPLQDLLCPGCKPDFQRCPNIVNPQLGFCDNHLGNLTNRVQGQPLVEPALVAEYKKALVQALQFPDDDTLVSNAIHLGNNLHMATAERMRTAHTMRDLAENRHADHLMQAQQLTYAATEHSNAAYLSAAANIQKVSALPAIASSRSIFSSLPSLPAPKYSAPLQLSSGPSSMYQQLPDARPDGRWMLEAAQTIIHDTPPSSPSEAAPTLVREANQPPTPLLGVPAIQPPPSLNQPDAPVPDAPANEPAATKPKRKAREQAPVPKKKLRNNKEF